MTAPKVRADYEQLKDAANRFSGQAQAARQTLQSLQRELDVLQGGDWVGQGATAFYQEMGGQVMPTLKRLATALESAQQTTLQISQIMAQAEADAARVLRGDGGDRRGVFGVAAGPVGGSGGAGGAGGAGAAQDHNAPTTTLADAVARMVAEENAAVDRKLSSFSQGVRDLVKRSPTLRAEIFKLDQERYTIKTGALAAGNFTSQHTITIGQPISDAETAAMIAHEVGHAVNDVNLRAHELHMFREEFLQASVDTQMRNEGMAQFNAAQVRAELNAAGGPDIGIPGGQTPDFQQAYDDFVTGKISHAQAVDRMGSLMRSEHVSVPPYTLYPDFYRNAYEFEWDTDIDQPHPPPRRP